MYHQAVIVRKQRLESEIMLRVYANYMLLNFLPRAILSKVVLVHTKYKHTYIFRVLLLVHEIPSHVFVFSGGLGYGRSRSTVKLQIMQG